MSARINRATTHDLANELLLRADSPITSIVLGRFIFIWDDKSHKAALATIPTSAIFKETNSGASDD